MSDCRAVVSPAATAFLIATDAALQTVLAKIVIGLMRLFNGRGLLVELKGSTHMTRSDSESDEARVLKPLG